MSSSCVTGSFCWRWNYMSSSCNWVIGWRWNYMSSSFVTGSLVGGGTICLVLVVTG